MTIIITAIDPAGSLHIVADTAEITAGEASRACKIYQNALNDMIWATAGYPPSRDMLDAEDVDSLMGAAETWFKANRENQLLIIEKFSHDARVWVTYRESEGSYNSLVEVQTGRVSIGAYASHWPRFRRSSNETDEASVARKFASLVSMLDGLGADCDYIEIGPFKDV